MKKNNNIKEQASYLKTIARLRRESNEISPESFILHARELFAISMKEANNLLTDYRKIVSGMADWNDEDKCIDVLSKASLILDHSMRLYHGRDWKSIESFMGRNGNTDVNNRIGVWVRHAGREPVLYDLWLNRARDLALISDMEQREDIDIICIVPWRDSIYEAVRNGCLNNLGDRENLHVYEGDIFVLFSKEKGMWDKPENNGVYAVIDGAYRKLLYTKGRGYVTIDMEANVASEEHEDDGSGDVFLLDGHRFNHHVMTMSHSWKRIGNIHADITLLMEKKKK